MSKRRHLPFLALLLPIAVLAQAAVPAFNELHDNEVVESGGVVYVRLSAPILDPSVPQEKILTLKGMRLLANWMCKFKPAPGQRLETTLNGIGVVDSGEAGERRFVVLKVKKQNPECRVMQVSAVSHGAAEPLPAMGDPPANATATGAPEMSSEVRNGPDVTVRRSPGEY